jgi:hypothetical protein
LFIEDKGEENKEILGPLFWPHGRDDGAYHRYILPYTTNGRK